MMRFLFLPITALLILLTSAAYAAEPGKAPVIPVIVEGITIGMPAKDAQAMAVKQGFTEAQKGDIDSKYSLIIYSGKAFDLPARLDLMFVEGKVVNIMLEAYGKDDAGKAIVKARQPELLKEWRALLGKETDAVSPESLEWDFTDVEISFGWDADGAYIAKQARVQ